MEKTPFFYTAIMQSNIINKGNMERLALKEEIVERIKKDQLLYGKIAYVMGVSVTSMPRILADNNRILTSKKAASTKLTDASTLRILREHLGVTQDSELLTESQNSLQA